jgi:hypothetical protein
MKKMMNRDYPLSPTPDFDSSGAKPPKNKKAQDLRNAAAEPTVGKKEKNKGKLTRGAGMGAVIGYAIGDIVNTTRRLKGKSHL